MVLSANLWSEQKNKEQLALILLPKIQNKGARGASDSGAEIRLSCLLVSATE